MSTPREKFQELLKKLFQFDCAELDFGIYRIMNQKRAVIEQFIETDLVKGIAKELKSGALAQEAGLAEQLAEVTAQIKESLEDDALDADGNLAEKYHNSKLGKQYLALRERAGKAKATPEQEADIFNHLYAFFSHYYDEGDFMSLRRYSKRDKYAIPYNGEEVHLHWANADQYYIKTGENFTDYSYKHGGWTVQFKLRNADVEQNNVKGAKRFFIPRAADVSLDEKNSTLTIPFEFRPLNASEEISYGKGNGAEENGNGKAKTKKKKGQEGILADAIAAIQNAAKKSAAALAALMHEKRKDADGNPVSLLEHHLRAYTRANSTDFFIHKDLKGFLERELDFYLKNEVLNLDELEAGGAARAESWFQALRTIKGIGRKIIAFVAQIENFQKRLFEKKKFVTEVHYCATLDRVPEELYPEIAKNKAQIEEWKRLFHIHEIERDTTQPGFKEPMKVDFLKANPFLVLDTKFFLPEFTEQLLASPKLLAGRSSLDEAVGGLLIHGNNFQALCSLRAWLKSRIDCIYNDPPYNTGASNFIYKNGYQRSSWLSMISQTIGSSIGLLNDSGKALTAIDDFELDDLTGLVDKHFGRENRLGILVVEIKPSGRTNDKFLSTSHEYYVCAAKNHERAEINFFPLSEEQVAQYAEQDADSAYKYRDFLRTGGYSTPEERPNSYYPIFYNPDTEKFHLEKGKGCVEILPIDSNDKKRVWRKTPPSCQRHIDAGDLKAEKSNSGQWKVYIKDRIKSGTRPKSVWTGSQYDAASHGTKLLQNMFGGEKAFDFPKSLYATKDCLFIASDEGDMVADFFGGSGTTAHAIIALNREAEDQDRRYCLIESELYFDTVLLPRVKKAVYAPEWKDGKPTKRDAGISHFLKYLRIESYEDALDNITFEAADAQTMFQLEDYVLSYMLDFETKQSETLLNVAKLDAPFDYKLKRHGKDEPLPVDLPETFNYLIGLHVASRRVHENKGVRYLVYCGKADGRETVILWRTTRGWKQEQFEADRDFVVKQKLTEGAEDIFVNGDSWIKDAKSLDPVFKKKMFNEE